MKKPLIIILMALCLSSCNVDMLGFIYTRSGDPDARFAQSMEYNAKAGFASITVPADEYRVYVMTDAHVTEKETSNLDRFVNDLKADKTSAPFWINLGDCVNDKGQLGVFESHIGPLEEAGYKHFPTAGNHDIYFGEWADWISRFHTATYWFEVITPSRGKDLFLSLESAGGTLGKDQRAWAEKILTEARGKYSHITVFTHTHFWKRDNTQFSTGNYNLEETYDLANLFSRSGVDVVLTGHDHATETTDYKGVRYETLESLKMKDISPGYNIFTYGSKIERKYIPVE
jgi:predicted phosphodiesterase